MRFLVDECTGPYVAQWLRANGHEVFSVFDQARGMKDDAIIRMAHSHNWILITNDRDFGEMVYREKRLHHGVSFLRLRDERAPSKIKALDKLLRAYSGRLVDSFVVVTETQVRFGA